MDMQPEAGFRAEKAREYFRRPGFERILAEIWKRYSALGRAGGHVKICELTEAECDCLNGFFGWNEQAGNDRAIFLKDFEAELGRCPFPPTIARLHEALMGQPLRTKEELQELQSRNWSSLFEPALGLLRNAAPFPNGEALQEWLRQVQEGRTRGYRTVREQFQASAVQAEAALLQACRGLIHVLSSAREPMERIRLPVLAGSLTGDSHAFDLKTTAGRLLWFGLQAVRSEASQGSDVADDPEPELDYAETEAADSLLLPDSLQIREVYRAWGIADDDISSWVHVYAGIPGKAAIPQMFTLRQVEAGKLEAILPVRRIYAVENPSIFSTLMDITERMAPLSGHETKGAPPLLICTSGQPSLACLQLIHRILGMPDSGGRLYYSGDFDLKGLEMGQQFARRFPDFFVPWRFDSRTYLTATPKGPSFTAQELARLSTLQISWDSGLIERLQMSGTKCFQETFVSGLAEDWIQYIRRGDVHGKHKQEGTAMEGSQGEMPIK